MADEIIKPENFSFSVKLPKEHGMQADTDILDAIAREIIGAGCYGVSVDGEKVTVIVSDKHVTNVSGDWKTVAHDAVVQDALEAIETYFVQLKGE